MDKKCIYMEWVKYRYSLFSSAVERQPFKLVVEGSIPSGGALFTVVLTNSNEKPEKTNDIYRV